MLGQIRGRRGKYTQEDACERPFGSEILWSLLDLGLIVIHGDVYDAQARVEDAQQYKERTV